MLCDDKSYGYIIVDGSYLLCAKMKGTNYEIVYKLSNNLPRKHNKGGQSSVRFERLYNEKKLLYIRKCIETINNIFITNEKVNVELIIIGGISNIKNKLYEDITLDTRIKNKINKNLLDIGSSGE
jgi:peptide chain release factor subunit 1